MLRICTESVDTGRHSDRPEIRDQPVLLQQLLDRFRQECHTCTAPWIAHLQDLF